MSNRSTSIQFKRVPTRSASDELREHLEEIIETPNTLENRLAKLVAYLIGQDKHEPDWRKYSKAKHVIELAFSPFGPGGADQWAMRDKFVQQYLDGVQL